MWRAEIVFFYSLVMRNRSLALLLSVFVLTGCGTAGGAFEVFNDDLVRLAGKPLHEAYIYTVGYLREVTPNSVKKLQNGNEIWEFDVERTMKLSGEKFNASIYVEVDVEKQKVVQASCRGGGCWRPY